MVLSRCSLLHRDKSAAASARQGGAAACSWAAPSPGEFRQNNTAQQQHARGQKQVRNHLAQDRDLAQTAPRVEHLFLAHPPTPYIIGAPKTETAAVCLQKCCFFVF